MRFSVRAIDANDHLIHLHLDAVNEELARQQAKERGVFVLEISPEHTSGSSVRKGFSLIQSKFSLLLFSQELQALLAAGLTIVEAIEALREKETHPAFAALYDSLLQGLREGKRFSQTLAEQPEVFTPLYVGIVQASERTSSLGVSLERFIQYQKRVDLIRNKVVSALIYPIILLAVGMAVSLFLIAYVVPRFSEVYRGTGRELPWMSQRLLEWGGFASQHGKMIFLVGLVLLSGSVLFARHLIRQGGVAALFSRLPGVGDYLRIYALSRVYLTLGMLLDGGIPVMQALATAAASTTAKLQTAVQSAGAEIENGALFSDAFLQHELTTPISYRLLRVGERSGELGNMLTQSANFYEAEISRWIDRFIRGFEPILMAIIGVIVGGIVVLLYMPIFDLADGLT